MARSRTIKNELAVLKNLNLRKRVKLRAKKIKSGYSLYLDFWDGNKRQYEFIKMYLGGTSKTHNIDKKILDMAISERDQRERLILTKNELSLGNNKQDMNFINFFESLAKKRDNAWLASFKHFKEYAKKQIVKFKNIDYYYCEKFMEYLKKLPIKQNSKSIYFTKFKTALNIAVKRGIIKYSPAKSLNLKMEQTNKEYLTLDELKKLIDVDIPNKQVKRAFIFSCFTGLRFSDLKALCWDNIENGYIKIRQSKTKQNIKNKLNSVALRIIKQQSEIVINEYVFNLPSIAQYNKILKQWAKKAGINKNLSSHKARHTFGTLGISSGIDLYSMQKLMGHSNIKTTQIYAKLVDKKKDEAIDKLPNI